MHTTRPRTATENLERVSTKIDDPSLPSDHFRRKTELIDAEGNVVESWERVHKKIDLISHFAPLFK